MCVCAFVYADTDSNQSCQVTPGLHWIPTPQASDDFALGVRSDREAYLRAADEAAQRTAS